MVRDVGESLSSRFRAGQNARERGLDPGLPCSICAQPFAGFDLQDDHVMPIGARRVDEGLVLVRSGDTFAACLPSEAPTVSEVFSPLPCAALAHASCNMSKGAARDIAQWRHPSLSALVIAINESGDRVVLPPVAVLQPSPEWDWTQAQREAYDRGVEALRRQGHESARRLKTTDEQRSEAMRLEREHRRAEAEAKADKMIRLGKAKLASMTDWREVSKALSRITPHLAKAVRTRNALSPEPHPDAYFDGCMEYDAALAAERRWIEVDTLAHKRRAELYESAVASFTSSASGRALADSLAALNPQDRVATFNRHAKIAAQTKHPTDRAKAQIARASLEDIDVRIAPSAYYRGLYAKLRAPSPDTPRTIESMDKQGRVIDGATGEILRTVKPPPRLSITEPPSLREGYDY